MSKEFILVSPSHSKEAFIQRMQRIVVPLLEDLLGSDAPKEITIDKSNNLCINGTPVGDWRKMCNFSKDVPFLKFDYNNSTVRYVGFGVRPFDNDYYKVYTVDEFVKGERDKKNIYNKWDEQISEN